MEPSYASLVKEAVVLLDKFNASRQCLDDFMEDASKHLQVQAQISDLILLAFSPGCHVFLCCRTWTRCIRSSYSMLSLDVLTTKSYWTSSSLSSMTRMGNV